MPISSSLHSIASNTQDVLFIIGPDNPLPTINKSDAENPGFSIFEYLSFESMAHMALMGMQLKYVRPKIIGNGLSDSVVKIAQIDAGLKELSNDATIFLLAHGSYTSNHGHYLIFGPPDDPDSYFKTETFLDKINDTGQKINLVMISCHSGIMHGYAEKNLPKGSIFLTLNDGDQAASKMDASQVLSFLTIENSIREIAHANPFHYPTGEFLFDKFLQNTLSALEEWDHQLAATKGPCLTVSGVGSCRFANLIADHRGRPFTVLERFYIEANTKGFDTIKDNNILSRIQNGSFDETSDRTEQQRAKLMLRAATNGRVPLRRMKNSVIS